MTKKIQEVATGNYYNQEIEEIQEELRRLTLLAEEEEKARKQAAEEQAQLQRKAEQAETKRKRQYEAHQNEIARVREIADKMEDTGSGSLAQERHVSRNALRRIHVYRHTVLTTRTQDWQGPFAK